MIHVYESWYLTINQSETEYYISFITYGWVALVIAAIFCEKTLIGMTVIG